MQIISLFLLSSIILSHLTAMDILHESTAIPYTMNAIEETTHLLVSLMHRKKSKRFSPHNITTSRSLICEGADLNKDGFCILHDAVTYNQEILVSDLIKAGADVNRNVGNTTPLLISCEDHVHPSIMHLLLQAQAHVNHKNAQGDTALHLLVHSLSKNASRTKVKDKICLLLRYGAYLGYLNNDFLSAEKLLKNLGLLKDRAGKTDTIEQLLISGTTHDAYKQWVEKFHDYESEKALKEQRFEQFLTLAGEFKDLYQPSDGNINGSTSCPEYPSFSMFTLSYNQ
ncbi:MAG: hypothetical protein M1114_06225 [Candidatus Dependentiae bacterium]|nr:hypothetical protein [Candidatus Dependentiae bacterium]